MAQEQTKPQAQKEKQTNCASCNKALRKLKRYYRNGTYYCSKKCWRQFVKKGQQEKK